MSDVASLNFVCPCARADIAAAVRKDDATASDKEYYVLE